MAIDTYQNEEDRLRKEELKKAGTPEEPEDTLTVKQILDDKEKSGLFGKMLEHDGDPADKEIMARLVSGKMEEGDIDRLAEARATFAEKMRDADTVRLEINPEMAQEMAKNDPEFEKILKIVGPERAAMFIEKEMRELSVTDPDKFEAISRNVKTLQSFKSGEYKRLDGDIVAKCKVNNWNVDSYMKVLAIKEEGERQEALAKMIDQSWSTAGGWGSVKSAINKIGGGFLSDEKAATAAGWDRIDITTALRTLEVHKKNLGSVLAASIRGNKDLLAAFSREIVGEPKKKELVGMNDVKKEMPTKENLSGLPEDFKTWRKKNNLTDADWNQLDDAQKDPHRDAYLKETAAKGKDSIAAKGGFWASIFGALFDSLFAGFDKKSLN